MSESSGTTLSNDDLRGLFGDYGREDYLTSEEPYRSLAMVLERISDDLSRKRAENFVRDLAKKAGCNKSTFDAMLKAAQKSERSENDQHIGFTGISDLLGGQWPSYGIYSCSDSGIWLFDPMKNQVIPVCSHPVFPTRRYTNIETGSELLDISFLRDGHWKTKQMIARQTIAQARQIAGLSEFGISVTSENAKEMVKYLCEIDDINRGIIPRTETISRLGWVDGRGFSPYIPDVAYDNAGKFGDAYAAVRTSGTLEQWLGVVKKVRENDQSKVAQIMLAASVASVLLRWSCNQPFLVHLWSTESGTGKTIALMLAASVWADPASGKYLKSLNSTNVAFEQLASFCNNLPLCLDELQTIQKNADFDDIIYMLCEGTGRARSTRNLGVREQSHWLNTILTNGEQPITNDSKGGAINRVISLETTGLVFPGGPSDLSEIADTLRENYGFAGKMIVDAITSDKTLPEKIARTYRNCVKVLLRSATGKQANYGATILTADWLFDAIITKDAAHRLKVEDIQRYLATPEDVDMNLRAKDWLIDFVTTNSANFVREGDSDDLVPRQIYGKRMNDGTIYIIPSVLRKEMRQSKYDYSAFLKWCAEKNYLITYHNKANRHWGIPTSILGVGGEVKALCFSAETFKPVEKQAFEAVSQPADFPF